MKKGILIIGIFLFGVIACITIENPFPALPPGIWRAELDLNPRRVVNTEEEISGLSGLTFQELNQDKLPFLFEVIYEAEDSFYIEIINGGERIEVRDIYFGLDRQTAKDTLVINFPLYDSHIKALYEERFLSGEWVVRSKSNYSIPFKAFYGKDYRFTRLQKEPKLDLSGRWKATFEIDTDDPYPAIAEFAQKGNDLTGTFLTETGDYRFLSGTVQDNKMYLSCFDGAHAFLFEAKIQDDSTLIGSFKSGSHYESVWKAHRDPEAELTDPHNITRMVTERFSFAFPNTMGDTISLDDPRFKDKVVLVQVLGSWCPNCRDETEFLVDFLQKHPQSDLAVVGVAFERGGSFEQATEQIEQYRKILNVPYPILYGGPASKKAASEAFPQLNEITSFPTLIFLDKDGTVVDIHTGFSGPATSKFPAFKQRFEATVDTLLKS